MVSSQDGNSILESDFESDKESDSLNWIVTPIYIVSHKQVVGIWWPPSDFEQLHQIMELAMYISANCYRALNRLNIAFFW